MKIYVRETVKKYFDPAEHFKNTKCSIEYFEDLFGTPYPFQKLDHIYVADYNMGAMEMVGAIIYTESYIPRDEKKPRPNFENYMNTIIHEISHMWFGNLVTMKWWDDLWLNESFANFIAFYCQSHEKTLAAENQYIWSNFLNDMVWAQGIDSMSTTHPIAGTCMHSG